MKQKLQELVRYPIVLLFMAFIMGFAVLDELYPKREFSDLENRKLAQRPEFSVSGLLEKNPSRTWMSQYDTYTKDQVAFRDSWIDLKSRSESLLLKTENNAIWFGRDGYLFPKLLAVNESQLEKNLGAIRKLCERHPGMVDVMIVPSASLILEEKLPFAAPVADEDAYLDQVSSALQGYANVIDTRQTLRESAQAGEYIYYRTDHHWTAFGAFAAYEQYMRERELPVTDLSQYTAIEVPNFYGTHYSKARNYDVAPDTITYYDIPATLVIHNLDSSGNAVEDAGPLYNTADFETRDKYKAFLRGNNGYSTVAGTGTGSILVVKDSYANCFIPYLIPDYANIGIVDFRYTNEKIDSILNRGGYERILILYSFQGFADDINMAGRIASA